MGVVTFFALVVLISQSFAQQQFDIVVYGATPAGLAAAISASKANLSVALLEPTSKLGGMMVAGGIGLRDLGVEGTLGGFGMDWAMQNAKFYGVNYPVYQPDMTVGEASVKLLLAQSSVKVFLNSAIYEGTPNVKKDGTKILSIITGVTGNTEDWQAKVFIDATYEGDIARFAGVSYTFGRESRDQYNEESAGVQAHTTFANFLDAYPVNATYGNGTLLPFVFPGPLASPGSSDKNIQGFSFRLCITDNTANQAPFPKPPGYNPNDFVVAKNYIKSLVESKQYPNGPPFSFLVDVLDYRNYPKKNKWDLCDSYSAFTSDCIGLNIGYPEGSRAQRNSISSKHYYYVAGFLTLLTTDPDIPPATRESTLKYGLCKDQWPDNANWPPQIYVRESLRIIGDKVMTQNDLVGGLHRNDSIGVGSWVIDIHVVQRISVNDNNGIPVVDNEGQMVKKISGTGSAYELPYYLLLPKKSEISNLLVPVCSSSSHIAFNSLRVEPTYVQLGQAAGNAAVVAIQKNLAVQDIPVSDVQELQVKQGVKITV